MNATQLIEAIADQAGISVTFYGDDDEKAREFEVRIAQQPNWPFEYGVGEVVGPDSILESEREEDECPDHDGYLLCHNHDCEAKYTDPDEPEPAKVIWIGEAGQIGYLPGNVKRTLGWGR